MRSTLLRRAIFWGALAAFFIGNGLMIATGAIGALVYQQPDVVDILAAQGLTFLGIIMLVLNACSAMFLVPAWVEIFKPKFIMGTANERGANGSHP